ncbi:GGDEF domain-containing protein [Pseudoalteromonas sp. NBT06-2]|uniref:EAL domain-containing protein n=1 Tax=Pseudoalteromonas sp. NBT06-2 TaxID=2025950 RepID=UPI000BA4F11D|nr:EAL domain-containing protein [Pseudoalteromonas sp. NBT06-2]PAJ73679.1 GGDEF domain-containing protein [Pseudoalteromonas sp. NBT06-2]
MRTIITYTLILSVFFTLFYSASAFSFEASYVESMAAIPIIFMAISLPIALFGIYKLRRSKKELKRSEERLKNSLVGSGDTLWDWNISTGEMIRMNDGQFIKQDENVTTPPNRKHIHPKDLPKVELLLKQHFSGHTAFFEASYRTKDNLGNWRWVLDRGKVIEHTAILKPKRMTGTLKDISRIKSTEEHLNLFAKCIENLSDPIAIYDKSFNFVEVNPSYLKAFGGQKAQYIGKRFTLHGYKDIYIDKLKKVLAEKGHWQQELKLPNQMNKLIPIDMSIDVVKNKAGKITHFIVLYNDISERKQTEFELQKLSNRDRLTGLPNRNVFFSNLKKLVDQRTHHSLLVFDLDNFKKINDSLGHHLGDMLLCRLANRLSKITRQQDSIYRLGGDEFGLVMTNTNDIYTITRMAKDFLAEIIKPFHMSGHELVITSSTGVVLFPEDGNSPEVLLKNADTAMYHAKTQGNRYLFFNDTMNKQAVKRLQIENLMRYGLKEDQFCVFYQPKMNLKTGELMGMEALVRFITPNKGLISPVQFIPIAEETGQIIEIGEVVLDKACRDVKKWLTKGLFNGRVAVNLSAKQFSLPDLTQVIDRILQKHNLPSYFLELEITEGTVMDDPKNAISIMKSLSERGIHLAMDDFGTGYSSLALLKEFPLNTLKIDKAFIDDICSKRGRNMVDSIVTIAHNLDLDVVAEGVEYSDQIDILNELNCEILQGYHYSKPLSAEQFEAFLLKKSGKAQSRLSLVSS